MELSYSLGLGLSSALPLTGELLEDDAFAPGLAPDMGSTLTSSPWGITVPARSMLCHQCLTTSMRNSSGSRGATDTGESESWGQQLGSKFQLLPNHYVHYLSAPNYLTEH